MAKTQQHYWRVWSTCAQVIHYSMSTLCSHLVHKVKELHISRNIYFLTAIVTTGALLPPAVHWPLSAPRRRGVTQVGGACACRWTVVRVCAAGGTMKLLRARSPHCSYCWLCRWSPPWDTWRILVDRRGTAAWTQSGRPTSTTGFDRSTVRYCSSTCSTHW